MYIKNIKTLFLLMSVATSQLSAYCAAEVGSIYADSPLLGNNVSLMSGCHKPMVELKDDVDNRKEGALDILISLLEKTPCNLTPNDITYIQIAADIGGCRNAMYLFAYALTTGEGISKNTDRACKYLTKSSKLGCKKSQEAIENHNIFRAKRLGKEYIGLKAELEDIENYIFLMRFVHHPNMTDKKDVPAEDLLSKIPGEEEYNKAWIIFDNQKSKFKKGLTEEVCRLLKESAAMRYGEAMYEVGIIQTAKIKGRKDKDYDKGVRSLVRAAVLNNHVESMFKLAILKIEENTELSMKGAMFWLDKAAELGHKDAKKELDKLNHSSLKLSLLKVKMDIDRQVEESVEKSTRLHNAQEVVEEAPPAIRGKRDRDGGEY